MRRPIIHRMIIILIMAIVLVSSPGCSCIFHSDIPWRPHLAVDNDSGAIVFYEKKVNENEHSFSAQKIHSDGTLPWGSAVYIDTNHAKFSDFWDLRIAADGTGGAFISWDTIRSSAPQISRACYIGRIDAGGKLLWQREVSAVQDVISSGGDAFVITQADNSDDLQVGTINKGGDYAPVEGIMLSRSGWSPVYVTGDITGGLIIYEQLEETLDSLDIWIKRLDSNGNWLGKQDGIRFTIKGAQHSAPHNPIVISSDNTSFIMVWEDIRNGLCSLYAQKYDYTGTTQWQPEGMKICYMRTNASFWPVNAVSDGAGGIIVTCSGKEADTGRMIMLAQRLDSLGIAQWGDDGIVVLENPHSAHSLVCDGSGGAVIAWGVEGTLFNQPMSYVQRLDAGGNKLWGVTGIKLE